MTRVLPYQLTENLFMLGHNLFLTYLVKGKPCALIDLGVSGTVPLISHQLKQIGVEAGDIGYLVVQHAHWDHVCGLPYLMQLSPKAVVVGTTKAREILGKPKIVGQFRQNDELYCSSLKERQVFEELPTFMQYDTLPIDQVVKDGETISLGNVELNFLDTPGHSSCSISVYLSSEKAVLISDALGAYLPQSDTFLPAIFQNAEMMLDSLEKIKKLDVNIVGYGHDVNMVTIGKEKISHSYNRIREEIVKLTTEIRQMAASGTAEEILLDKLYRACFKGFLAEIYPPEFIKSLSPFLLKAITRG